MTSCTSKTQDVLDEWSLERSEQIEHQKKGNLKYQTIYSAFNSGSISFTDTTVIVQKYKDSLLIEEVEYNIESGDSTKWRHHINGYNANGLIVNETDSVNGSLRHQNSNFYKENRIQRSEFISIMPDYNESMELTGTDTVSSIVHSYYDEAGRCIRVMALSKDRLSSKLTGIDKFDSTLTFNQFDEQSNKIGSITLVNGDTSSISKRQYDEFGRETSIGDASLQFGTSKLSYVYDEKGNRTSELLISDNFTELTVTQFDELNRPIIRKTYKPKTLANNR